MRWLADENFRNAIIRGVLRRFPRFDVFRAQDIRQVAGQADVELLAWATQEHRLLLTHDLSTMIPAMQELLQRKRMCTPIVLVPDSLDVGTVIDDILLLENCATEIDWASGVVYLPLR